MTFQLAFLQLAFLSWQMAGCIWFVKKKKSGGGADTKKLRLTWSTYIISGNTLECE